MTTGLFLLRCTQMGISLSELDHVTVGMVLEMAAESALDKEEPVYKATQEDFDKF